MNHTGGCVPWGVDCESIEVTNFIGIAIFEERIELAPVALELRAFIEHLAKRILDNDDLLSDADLTAQLVLNIRGRAQVVGMDMRFNNPFKGEPAILDLFDQRVGMFISDPTGRIINIHHTVDDRTCRAGGVLHDIADRVGDLVKETLHVGLHVHLCWVMGHCSLRL